MELFYILFGALLLDAIIGDPQLSWHPVALMGKFALHLEILIRGRRLPDFLAGIICTSIVIITAALPAYWVSYEVGIAAAIVALFIAIALKSLLRHVTAIEQPLRMGALNKARQAVGMITSRDTNMLDEVGVIRSAIESIGENIIDGVTAPLFYATLGWSLGGIAGAAAGAIGYRAVNTLDATFGYKNRRYYQFGTFPARLDDLLNFIPARITLVAIYLAALILKLRAVNAIKYAWRDRKKHPSPNSTWGMAAFAGALGVKLGGSTYYKDKLKNYPSWGEEYEKLAIKHLSEAKTLAALTTFIFSAMMLLVLFL